MREIEIKLPTNDLDRVISKLEKLGCKISEPTIQEDINFVHKDDTEWFETTNYNFCYPRLRIENNLHSVFTIKKPLTNEMDCEECEFNVESIEKLKDMMRLFNYIEGVTVKKTRRKCKYKDYEITLDKVYKLGDFVEIERVVDDEDPMKIQSEMFKFAKEELDLDKDDKAMKGYDILMYHFENK